ncbi:MAG: FISUMP domain-containing protein [Bacteroidota bacterium]
MSRSKRTFIKLSSLLLLGMAVLLFSLQTCRKFEPDGFLHVTTGTLYGVTANSAHTGGEVTTEGGSAVTLRGVCWGSKSNPTISDNHTEDGMGAGAFTSEITGLAPYTAYYVRAFASNSEGTTYGEQLQLRTLSASDATVTDIDGNVYQTIRFGEQIWMKENLKTTRYANGISISYMESAADWAGLGPDGKAYCWYDNSMENRDIYGGLYTWAAAMNGAAGSITNPSGIQGVCPDGWHLPSNSEWMDLEIYLGLTESVVEDLQREETVVGGKMKEEGTSHWNSPNTGATNSSGFSALPAGYMGNGGPEEIGKTTRFWSASEFNNSYAWIRTLNFDHASVSLNEYDKYQGISVRCVQGDGMAVRPSVTTLAITEFTSSAAKAGGEVTYDGEMEVTVRGVCWSTSAGPTISDDTTLNGTGTGKFESEISGLDPGTKYYVKAYAMNRLGTGYGNEVSFRTKFDYGYTVTDIDGNVYNTIQIGDQLWMAENLKTTRYADGSAIPHVESTLDWDLLGDEGKAYCWYNNQVGNKDIYGALYSWSAALNGATTSAQEPSGIQGACPDGWHVPSNREWKTLERAVGMTSYWIDLSGWRGTDEGGKLKEQGFSHWVSPNSGASNESGFTALPGGNRGITGNFSDMGSYGYFCSTTEYLNGVVIRYLSNTSSQIWLGNLSRRMGTSVRCLADL